ncbi:hypothetical protein [Clostridium beijerinckii]|uniref:hypothetical protein n=1 Tax=Clostridium beijerinckii TaxID=1520 RepID=UPI001F4C0F76|nr:hypothetical protein [Clostridium beijerinckii]NOW02432.1 hypothetical protein [Clostridium beijerinckii]
MGAIVGGISGIGTQKENKTHNFIVINYKSKDDEIKVLSFEIVGSSLHWSSFVDELKQKIKKEDVPNEIHL